MPNGLYGGVRGRGLIAPSYSIRDLDNKGTDLGDGAVYVAVRIWKEEMKL